MKNQNFLNIPNLDKNVKVQEASDGSGLWMCYTLPCPKDYPYRDFESKGKWYARRSILVYYAPDMTRKLNFAYHKLKSSLMLDLAQWHLHCQEIKVRDLQKEVQLYKIYNNEINIK